MDPMILDEDFSKNELQYAGFWIRVGASLLDSLILAPLIALSFYNILSIKSLPLALAVSLVSLLYKPYLEWKRSATFGKSIVGIKLVTDTGAPITLKQALVRYFPWAISYILSLATTIQLFIRPGFDDVTEFVEYSLFAAELPSNQLTSSYGLIFMLIIGVLIFDKKKQGLHDKAADTFCVRNGSKINDDS